MKPRHNINVADDWTMQGQNILAPEKLTAIRTVVESEGPVIVEHWFYYGSSEPNRMIFDDFDEFVEYLHTNGRAGDAIHVWNFAKLCCDDNALANGKCPADQGGTPKRGSY